MRSSPDGWRWIELGEAAEDIRTGFSARPSVAAVGTPQLRTNNITPEGLLALEDIKYVDASPRQIEGTALRAGDVLFNNTNSPAHVGKTAYIDRDLPHLISNHLTRIRVNRSAMEPRYLVHAINHARMSGALSRHIQQWVNQAAINTDRLRSLRIHCPPVVEQRALADLLDAASRARQLQDQANRAAEALLPSVFAEMFAEHLSERASGLRIEPLEALADVVAGFQVTPKRTGKGGVPYLRVANVHRDDLDLMEVKTMSVSASELESRALLPRDVLVVEGHGNAGELGRAALWSGEIQPCVHQNHIIRVRIHASSLLPEYLSALINSSHGRRYFARHGRTTSGLNTISTRIVRGFPVLLASVAQQQELAALVHEYTLRRKAQRAQAAELTRLFSSLLDRALTGGLSPLAPGETSAPPVSPPAPEPVATAGESHPDRPIWSKLSSTQRNIWQATLNLREPFDLVRLGEALRRKHGQAPHREHLRGALEVLTVLGAVIKDGAADLWRAPTDDDRKWVVL